MSQKTRNQKNLSKYANVLIRNLQTCNLNVINVTISMQNRFLEIITGHNNVPSILPEDILRWWLVRVLVLIGTDIWISIYVLYFLINSSNNLTFWAENFLLQSLKLPTIYTSHVKLILFTFSEKGCYYIMFIKIFHRQVIILYSWLYISYPATQQSCHWRNIDNN